MYQLLRALPTSSYTQLQGRSDVSYIAIHNRCSYRKKTRYRQAYLGHGYIAIALERKRERARVEVGVTLERRGSRA